MIINNNKKKTIQLIKHEYLFDSSSIISNLGELSSKLVNLERNSIQYQMSKMMHFISKFELFVRIQSF